MCPCWFLTDVWRITSSTNQTHNWFGNLPPDLFADDTWTLPPSSSSSEAQSIAQSEHKLAPYSKTARNIVNKELVNQPLREAEGYEYTDKPKTSYWDFYQFSFLQGRCKTTWISVSCCSLLLIHQEKETIPKILDVPNGYFLYKYLKSCPSPSKKAGDVVWSEQDRTKHEFHMDGLLIISSYYLV